VNIEDWENRCDSYRELATRLQSKLEALKEINEALQFRNQELYKQNEKMKDLIFYIHDNVDNMDMTCTKWQAMLAKQATRQNATM